ncbi:MAG TPA: oligopeptide ABC transporter permease [Bacillales bacterium]|nr:oligopeptide ABC transporter permease [Bacillales bacterium]
MDTTEKGRISNDMFQPAEIEKGKAEEITMDNTGFWKDSWRRMLKNKGAVFGLICILFFIVMALVGPELNPFSYKEQHIAHQFLPPKVPVLANVHWLPFDGYAHGVDQYKTRGVDTSYWFGSDEFGRDQWTRVWKGTQISLFIAFVASFIDFLIGVAYGGISGYFGGKVDNVMQRFIEVLVGIPNLILIILILLFIGGGIWSIILALIISNWIGMARIVRGQVIKLKKEEFVLGSKTLGASHTKVIIKGLLPNTMAQIIITTMFTIPNAIFFEAFLSFIGLGLTPPTASLGTLINDGFQSLSTNPYLVIYPGVVISLLLISFNLLGDGLRDAFDPKMREGD